MSFYIPQAQLPSSMENAYFAIVLEKGKPYATRQCAHLFDIECRLWAKYCNESSKSCQFSRYYSQKVREYGVQWLASAKNAAIAEAAQTFCDTSVTILKKDQFQRFFPSLNPH